MRPDRLARRRSRCRPRGRVPPRCASARSSGGSRRRSRAPRDSSARASAADPPRDICALAGLASSEAMWWPKPRSRRSTSRRPLKNRRPALTAGCSNSCSTNSSGESALDVEQMPAGGGAGQAARGALRGGSGGARPSGARIAWTIGTNSSCQRAERRGVARTELRERRRRCARCRSTIRARARRRSAARR